MLVSLTFLKKVIEKNRRKKKRITIIHLFRKVREANIHSKSFLKFYSAHFSGRSWGPTFFMKISINFGIKIDLSQKKKFIWNFS